MNLRNVILIIIVFGNTISQAQNNSTQGPYQNGLAGIQSVGLHLWMVGNNPAAMAQDSSTGISFAAINRFGLKTLSTYQAVVTSQYKGLHYGLDFYHYGDVVYSEKQSGLNLGISIGKSTYLGVRGAWDTRQFSHTYYGKKHNLIIGFGFYSGINAQWEIGFVASNLTRAALAEFNNEHIPFQAALGMGYLLGKNLKLLVEFKHQSQQNLQPKIALNYTIKQQLDLRMGYRPVGNNLHCGMGYKWKAFALDWAMFRTSKAGFSNQISIGYAF